MSLDRHTAGTQAADVPFRPTGFELNTGFVPGPATVAHPYPRWPRFAQDMSADPRAVLELVIAEFLETSPCTVQFSGGRDSSLVLAIAAHVARTRGLPLPHAVTMRYPAVVTTDEANWQDLVTRHLDLPLTVIEVPPGGNELAGALAVSRMVRDGPLFPPTAGISQARIAPEVAGRTVLTGEGGDNVLGAMKVTRWAAHAHQRRLPRGDYARIMAEDVAPPPLRRALVRRRISVGAPYPWLRPAARSRVLTALAADESRQPWDWRRATWDELDNRLFGSMSTLDLVAAREGFRLEHPLLDRRFVGALCRRAGLLGFRNRSQIMALLAEDLLPPALLRRSTKATFNEIFAGDSVRSFARVWDGSGVDPDIIDVEALRAAWLATPVHASTLAPLRLALCHAAQTGWRPPPERAAESGTPRERDAQ